MQRQWSGEKMPEPNEIDIIFYEVGLALDHVLLLLYHIVKVDRTRERDTYSP